MIGIKLAKRLGDPSVLESVSMVTFPPTAIIYSSFGFSKGGLKAQVFT